ncbi:MAG: hypothetical protein K2K50_06080, partial [Anaeroplasmataceae bacterium]|nr:hypothetical protein [Anaeroplasmataceae bacterium]
NILPIYLVFGFFFLLSILSLPLYFKKFRKEYERQEKMDTDEVIEEINNQRAYNKLEYDVQQVRNVVQLWKKSSKGDIIKGLLFLFFFLGCCAGFVICMSLGYTIWGFVCFGLGAGEIILALIVVKFLETSSLRLKKGRTYTKSTATVLGCTMSSQSSTGTRNHTNIRNITYKVFLNNKRIAYSKEYYTIGEKVDINIDTKNPKRIMILGKHEDIFDIEENEF